MSDSIALLLTGGLAALLAWVCWHYLGENAMTVFTTGMLVLTILDNIRLRRVLKKR